MASTNQSPFYKKAESKFLQAKTNEEKLKWLEEMIKECPKHKSSEKMLANLKTRYIKLQEKIESVKKTASSRGRQSGIKKEDMQAVIVGFTNSGKSSLLKTLTNTYPKISKSELEKFTTRESTVGMMPYESTQIQIIEIPALESEFFDKGTTNTADTIIILVNKFEDIEKTSRYLEKAHGKKIIVVNKIDLLSDQEKRKLKSRLESKKINFILISTYTEEGIPELKEKLFKSFDNLRVYTREPGKEKSKRPIIMRPDSTVKNVAEKILKGLSGRIKETKIWGPSSKFPGQVVGLNHKLKDLDVVEFKIK